MLDTELKEEKIEIIEKGNKRIINGKEYTIHMPSDPAEDNICDGCQ